MSPHQIVTEAAVITATTATTTAAAATISIAALEDVSQCFYGQESKGVIASPSPSSLGYVDVDPVLGRMVLFRRSVK